MTLDRAQKVVFTTMLARVENMFLLFAGIASIVLRVPRWQLVIRIPLFSELI